MNYYISDTHFGHANIIKLSHRPFYSVEDMDNELIKNWNSVVTDEDDVYFLGDFAYKNGKHPQYYLNKLNGKLHIVLGNHDKNIRNLQHKKIVSVSVYEDIVDNGQRLILFHYPMVEWNGYFRNSIHLYGHIHNNTMNQAYGIVSKIPNAYNVGADILDFTPRTLKQVIEYNERFRKSVDADNTR